MTIAISLKVNDGLVLASDSASTIYDPTGQVIKVYNSANKIFNLRKGLPIGAITWGAGSIGPAAISTLAKDLRLRFSGLDPSHIEWALDPDKYALADVASRVREFIFEELYVPVFQNQPVKPYLGFVVSGYSAGAAMAEEYEIVIANGACDPPKLLRDKAACGVAWRGQPEAVRRLLLGYSHELASVLENSLAVPKTQLADALRIIQSKCEVFVVSPAMPIQDAIDLAEFLVSLTINYERFRLARGAGTVGGPIEIAAITKHEGFKWVKRKHYFSGEFNPEIPDEE